MGRRAARVIVGAGLAACALLTGRLVVSSPATAATVSTPVAAGVTVRGAVPATGSASGDGWSAGRPEVGRYLVALDEADDLSVRSWDGVATVLVTPVGEGVALVSFTSPAGTPVDAAFTFVASG